MHNLKRLSITTSPADASEPEPRRMSEQIIISNTLRSSSLASNSSDIDSYVHSAVEGYQRGPRLSLDSAKSVRMNLERDETLYPLTERIDENVEENADRPVTNLSGSISSMIPSAATLQSLSSRQNQDHVFASRGVVPDDLDKICIIAPGREISDEVVPNCVNDVVVARLDRMSPNEQLILKCASVLGMNFTRQLLSAIVPRKIRTVLDTTLYRLSKERLVECGSLALQQSQQHNHYDSANYHHHHHHKSDLKPKSQVLCGCFVSDGLPVLNLSQSSRQLGGRKKLCQYFHFSNAFVREAAYDLWLEDQRKALHERAAMFLETQVHRCKACGGTSFVPGIRLKPPNRASTVFRTQGKCFLLNLMLGLMH